MEECKIIELPKIIDARGNLTFIQHPNHLPFEIKRVFWIYDVPAGENRGGHAYKTQNEVIISLSGSFDVVVTMQDNSIKKYTLNRGFVALHLPPMKWRHIENFSTNAVSLHLCSGAFDENDYLRNISDYLK